MRLGSADAPSAGGARTPRPSLPQALSSSPRSSRRSSEVTWRATRRPFAPDTLLTAMGEGQAPTLSARPPRRPHATRARRVAPHAPGPADPPSLRRRRARPARGEPRPVGGGLVVPRGVLERVDRVGGLRGGVPRHRLRSRTTVRTGRPAGGGRARPPPGSDGSACSSTSRCGGSIRRGASSAAGAIRTRRRRCSCWASCAASAFRARRNASSISC